MSATTTPTTPGAATGAAPPPRDAPSTRTVVAAIIAVELRRLVRDRTSFFFMIALPIGIIVLIGSSINVGPSDIPLGVVDLDRSAASARLIAALPRSGALEVTTYEDQQALTEDIRVQTLSGGLVIPAGFTDSESGESGALRLLTDTKQTDSPSLGAVVRNVIGGQGNELAAARFATDAVGGSPADNLARAERATAALPAVPVQVESIGEAELRPENKFAYIAPQQLILFMFIATLMGGISLVDSRRYGVTRRELAAPLTAGSIVLGEAAARYLVALLQAGLILAIGGLLFGVTWGDPIGLIVLVLVFAAVCSAAAILIGSLARTQEQAASIGVPVALGLAMLGGGMWPLEIVPAPLRAAGHLTPHAWAIDALHELVFERGGLAGILLPLGVLALIAVALMAAATNVLRRTLTTSPT